VVRGSASGCGGQVGSIGGTLRERLGGRTGLVSQGGGDGEGEDEP
jgi:hypothetical protein